MSGSRLISDHFGIKMKHFIIGITLFFFLMTGSALADTRVIGDSLTNQTYESGGWYVNAKDGRALWEAMSLTRSTASNHPNDIIVIALGSNDVADNSTTIVSNINRVMTYTDSCVVITTVKVNGVTPFYTLQWRKFARIWNNAARNSGAVIADWNAYSYGKPGWFLGDGLHLTGSGKIAYNNMLRNSIRGC